MGYRVEKVVNTLVTYLLEGEGATKEFEGEPCYSYLFHSTIPEKWKSLLIRERAEWVHYEEAEIKRWLNDLEEIGFPSHFDGLDETLRIRLIFDEYKTKLQLCSALQLLRCLWEDGVNTIPEIYFEAMDANPEADKLNELQNAHKSPRVALQKRKGNGYNFLPEGHMVTFPNNGEANIDRKLLLERLTRGGGVHKEGGIGGRYGDRESINEAWRAPEPKRRAEYNYE